MLPPKWVIDGAKRLLIEGIFVSIPVIMAASLLFPDEARFHHVITKIAPLFFIYSSFKAGIIKSFQGICLLVSVTAFICLGMYRSKKMRVALSLLLSQAASIAYWGMKGLRKSFDDGKISLAYSCRKWDDGRLHLFPLFM